MAETTTTAEATKVTTEETTTSAEGEKKPTGNTLTMTQEELDAQFAERLKQWERKQERTKQEADQAAEADRLRKAAEFEQLAGNLQKQVDTLQARVNELAEVEAERDEAMAEVNRLVDDMMTGIPGHLQKALAKMTPIEKLAYLREEKDALAITHEDIPRTPKGGEKPNRQSRVEAEREAMRTSRRR